MARTIIELPEEFIFTSEYRVLITDINAANHLGADKIIPIVIDAQMQLFAHLGYGGSSTIEDASYIMVDSEVMYQSESVNGDVLKIDVAAANFGRCNFELIYQIYNKASSHKTARVKCGMLFYDFENKAPLAAPEQFKRKCGVS